MLLLFLDGKESGITKYTVVFVNLQDPTAPRGLPAEEHAGVAGLQEGVLRVAGAVHVR